MQKIWHRLNYEGHFVLPVCLQPKVNASFEHFWKFNKVLQTAEILPTSLDAQLQHVLTIPSGKILYESSESSSTVAHIAVSLTLE